MKITRVLWLIYKRLRTAFGVSLGFILIYGAYTGNLTLSLLPIALGFWCIHVYGDCYNDFEDYEQDIKNNRKDKWTTTGLLTREQMRNFSFFMCFFGLVFLWFTNFNVFLLGLLYSTTLFCYSNPKIHLKLYDFYGYVIVAFPLLLLPITLNTFFHRGFSLSDLFFTFFCFSQYVYLYCQKDSTDLKDETNLFLKRGWKNATFICVGFAILASSLLLTMSFFSIVLLLVWGVHVFSKSVNLYKIYKKKITRKLRARLILVEFLTPYLYTGGVILGL
jgi:4-hydroxybenzoate polyprenyltransferase